jgi:cell division control protein 6
MTQQKLKDILVNYINNQKSIFKNRSILTPEWLPNATIHREEQIKTLISILAPAIKGYPISNIFIYGGTGTGKTLVIRHIISELQSLSNLKFLYVNCKMKKISDTEYRLLAEMCRALGKNVPATGLPTDEIYKIFYSCLPNVHTILVLDEIDALIKKVGDGILYNFLRIREEMRTKLSLIGISNDIAFIENLDPRVRSSLSEEEIIFPPYNASQLQDILTERVKLAFDEGVIEQSAIAKCAALAAQEHGDARRAIDLLRVAAELAERAGAQKVTIEWIDMAENKLDFDRYVELIRTLPRQSKAVLLAIIKLAEKEHLIQTGDVIALYERICSANGIKLLTTRRISDLIAELDMQGIITTRIISKGRYGRSREIALLLPKSVLEKIKAILLTHFSSL